MKFLIITHTLHKSDKETLLAYAPYVREMNIWLKHVKECKIVAPFSKEASTPINLAYSNKPELIVVPKFSLLGSKEILLTLWKLPLISYKIYRAMCWAEHIHLRLPGNMGLLGSIIQLFFPNKPKTVKYAGNWDSDSKQPWSYNVQKWIVNNTFLSKNIKVLVYGKWPNQTKNTISFFTATYKDEEIIEIPNKVIKEPIKLLFVGALVKGKRPMLAIQTLEQLIKNKTKAHLDIYGEGTLQEGLDNYITKQKLSNYITFHGNQSAEIVKEAYKQAHFLIFMSKSEGWPKVVAEAMLWKCLPITTRVSAVPYMLGEGKRGSLVEPDTDRVVAEIVTYLLNKDLYTDKINKAYQWAKDFTLEKFEREIKKLLRKDA